MNLDLPILPLTCPIVYGLHSSDQTKDDVCLVLDLLHGGTLSFLLHQKKKVSERYGALLGSIVERGTPSHGHGRGLLAHT